MKILEEDKEEVGISQLTLKNYTGNTDFKMDDINGKETAEKVDGCNYTIKMIEEFSNLALNKVSFDWA